MNTEPTNAPEPTDAELADAVREAVRALNDRAHAARARGLSVELDTTTAILPLGWAEYRVAVAKVTRPL